MINEILTKGTIQFNHALKFSGLSKVNIMQNRSEFTANQFLSGQQMRYNKRLDRKNTPSNLALFVLIFGAIGFLLAISFFA